MPSPEALPLASLPSVERLLNYDASAPLIAEFGRPLVTSAMRAVLAQVRTNLLSGGADYPGDACVINLAANHLRDDAAPSLRRVFNLSGIVLHTNLGRAALPEEAIEAVVLVARDAANLEF